jgi:hypothetical protein
VAQRPVASGHAAEGGLVACERLAVTSAERRPSFLSSRGRATSYETYWGQLGVTEDPIQPFLDTTSPSIWLFGGLTFQGSVHCEGIEKAERLYKI